MSLPSPPSTIAGIAVSEENWSLPSPSLTSTCLMLIGKPWQKTSAGRLCRRWPH
jgi:hypothetical protein